MEKILTITIPAYNVSKYLPEVIPTFLQPEVLEDIELLIVNDGSKDNTKEIAEKYQEKYPSVIRVINKENGGHGSTINRGISEAKGKYFKVVDGDDWVDSDEFIRFVGDLKSVNTDVVMNPYKCVYVNEGKEEIKSNSRFECGKVYQISNIIAELGNNYVMHALTYRTEVLKRIKQISENCFYVDQEYICYPLQFVNSIAFFDEVVYQYRLGTDEQSVNIEKLKKNVRMHGRVTNSIANLVLECDDVHDNLKSFLIKRADFMLIKQLFIFLMMPASKSNLTECKKFFKDYLQKNRKIYKCFSVLTKAVATCSTNLIYWCLSPATKIAFRVYQKIAL